MNEDIKDGDVDNEGLVILLYELSREVTILINDSVVIIDLGN